MKAPVVSERMELLLEISKALIQFETVEQVVPAILDTLSEAIPLRTAVLIAEIEKQPTVRAWRAEDASATQLQEAEDRARASYRAYFRGSASPADQGPERSTPSPRLLRARPPVKNPAAATTQTQGPFIMLPLVVGHRPVFGALQIERSGPMDEEYLIFLNTVVNQLAIALDRHIAWRREVVARERAQSLEQATTDLLQREQLALEEARAANRSREELLGIVSRDLRSLAYTTGFEAYLLLETPMRDEPGRRRRLEAIRRSATLMSGLLQTLLEGAAAETGELSVSPSPCSALDLITAATETYRSLSQSSSVTLRLEVPADLPPVQADSPRVQQALGNLIENAIDFSPAGGTVTVRARGVETEVRISVTDHGPGIPRADHELVFERYWRKRPPGSTGAGLGLFIAKTIIHQHGGRIGVESQPGQGSTFWFTIPVVGGRVVTDRGE
ncbi:MAG: hypothetical protein HY700_09250 [Gemmatimonadetes bacterium]|nr:hypothetical protein [Gemmatimonadota bacterium]